MRYVYTYKPKHKLKEDLSVKNKRTVVTQFLEAASKEEAFNYLADEGIIPDILEEYIPTPEAEETSTPIPEHSSSADYFQYILPEYECFSQIMENFVHGMVLATIKQTKLTQKDIDLSTMLAIASESLIEAFPSRSVEIQLGAVDAYDRLKKSY